MNGFRVEPKASKKERIDALEQQLNSLATANSITSMLIQKVSDAISKQEKDIMAMRNLLHDVQYRTLAMIDLHGLQFSDADAYKDTIDATADKLRLVDYNIVSDKEDELKGLIPADVIEEVSHVIFTSTTNTDPDRGIFRTKLELMKTGAPALINALIGKKVGDKVEVKLNGDNHVIEVLGVRNPKPNPQPLPKPTPEQAQG